LLHRDGVGYASWRASAPGSPRITGGGAIADVADYQVR
jgi:hypothetical protein